MQLPSNPNRLERNLSHWWLPYRIATVGVLTTLMRRVHMFAAVAARVFPHGVCRYTQEREAGKNYSKQLFHLPYYLMVYAVVQQIESSWRLDQKKHRPLPPNGSRERRAAADLSSCAEQRGPDAQPAAITRRISAPSKSEIANARAPVERACRIIILGRVPEGDVVHRINA